MFELKPNPMQFISSSHSLDNKELDDAQRNFVIRDSIGTDNLEVTAAPDVMLHLRRMDTVKENVIVGMSTEQRCYVEIIMDETKGQIQQIEITWLPDNKNLLVGIELFS